MKTYSPVADLADIDWWVGKMEADPDGEWVNLEDHLAVVAENALKVKRRDVEIEKLNSTIEQLKFDLACKKDAAGKPLQPEPIRKESTPVTT